MSEKIRFIQNKNFQVEFFYRNPGDPEAVEMDPVSGLHEITPYGMMLFSLASCTAQVVLGYTQHHELDLQEVEIELVYERDYQDDCENCEEKQEFRERIQGEINFKGDLSEQEQDKLYRISKQCPIEKIFEEGIAIKIQQQSG